MLHDQRQSEPLLNAVAGNRVLQSVADTAHECMRLASPTALLHDPSLAFGAAGISLFLAYAGSALGTDDVRDSGIRWAEGAANSLKERNTAAGLFEGFTGVAWVVAHLQRRFRSLNNLDLSEIDDELLRSVSSPPSSLPHGLWDGLVGLAVYGYERDVLGKELLFEIVDRLDELADVVGGDATWLTPTWHIAPHRRPNFPKGAYALGLESGAASVLLLLAAAVRDHINDVVARRLLVSASAWLMHQKFATHDGVRFPSIIEPGIASSWNPAEDSWSKGTAGIAVSLLAAAEAVGDEGNRERAIAMALSTVSHERLQVEPDEPLSFRTGLAGQAVICAQLFRRTGRPEFATAARNLGDRLVSALETRVATTSGSGRVSGHDLGLMSGRSGACMALLTLYADDTLPWEMIAFGSLATA